MTIIGTKRVFRNKLDENGVVSQNKARLVAQGYNQQEGIDYDETYAPVARLESIRILLAYACALDFKLFQMDVKSAFLNGFINEEEYGILRGPALETVSICRTLIMRGDYMDRKALAIFVHSWDVVDFLGFEKQSALVYPPEAEYVSARKGMSKSHHMDEQASSTTTRLR
ncbi:copia protein [Tanacetum coccineum]